ncbi:MAG: HDOD domain-containing protein [Chitinivibrionales bacterium]|nr:HDOD domain-containing protein [Chitinivibrionales bacterium]
MSSPLENAELRERIEHITNLPTLPQVATRLISIINKPSTSFSDVAFVVGQDMALSAKILRMANSAFYGVPRTVSTVQNAVAILGLKVITTLVVSLTVFDLFPKESKKLLFDRKAFWYHCLGCGLIAKLYCNALPKVVLFDAEEAFCAGLLHDIGKVVMEQYLHADFHKALRHAAKNHLPLYESEKEILGFTHTDVGAWLIGPWGLPLELSAPIAYHHEPESSPDNLDIVALVHFADYTSYEMNLCLDPAYGKPTVNSACVKYLMLADRQVAQIKEQIPAELKKMDVFYTIAEQP